MASLCLLESKNWEEVFHSITSNRRNCCSRIVYYISSLEEEHIDIQTEQRTEKHASYEIILALIQVKHSNNESSKKKKKVTVSSNQNYPYLKWTRHCSK